MVAMRSPIPPAIREELSQDPFMRDCIVMQGCDGRIHFDHAFTYAGKRVNEIWAILPLCRKHNMGVTKMVQTAREMNLRARIKHFDAESDFRAKYPKSNLLAPLRYELV